MIVGQKNTYIHTYIHTYIQSDFEFGHLVGLTRLVKMQKCKIEGGVMALWELALYNIFETQWPNRNLNVCMYCCMLFICIQISLHDNTEC